MLGYARRSVNASAGNAGSPTAEFREEHRHLMAHVDRIRLAAGEVRDLPPGERAELVTQILEFLRGTLLPHAEWEEQVLYTAVGELLGDARATAAMTRDHVAIGRMIEALGETDLADIARLQELLYGLHAVITVHFEKGDCLPVEGFGLVEPDMRAAKPGQVVENR